MENERKSAPGTAIPEGAKANNHDYNTAPSGECKELTLEDLENSDLYYPIFSAFLELETAYYLAEEVQEDYFEKLNPDVYKNRSDYNDNTLALWDFDRYRAKTRALFNAIVNAYSNLKEIGISRH